MPFITISRSLEIIKRQFPEEITGLHLLVPIEFIHKPLSFSLYLLHEGDTITIEQTKAGPKTTIIEIHDFEITPSVDDDQVCFVGGYPSQIRLSVLPQ